MQGPQGMEHRRARRAADHRLGAQVGRNTSRGECCCGRGCNIGALLAWREHSSRGCVWHPGCRDARRRSIARHAWGRSIAGCVRICVRVRGLALTRW